VPAWTVRPDASAGQHLSAPVVAAGTVVVTGPRAMYAFDATDQSLRWSAERDGVPVVPAIGSANGSNVVVSTSGRGADTATVSAVDLASGKPAWDSVVRLKEESRSGVTVDGSRAFLGDENGHVYAIDLGDGSIDWTRSVGGSIAGPVAAADGVVIVVAAASDTSRSATIAAIDEATGDQRWAVIPDAAATFGSLPAIAGGVVVVAFPDGEVVGLSTQDGSETWRQRIPALVSPFVTPAVTGDSLVFADSNGGVHLVSPETGEGWLYEFNEAILRASPVVAGGSVVVGFEDGSIGAVSLDTGHLVFRSASTGTSVGGIALTSDVVIVSRGGSGAPELASFSTDANGALLDDASPTDPVATELAGGFLVALVLAALVYAVGRALRRRTAIVDPSVASDGELDAEVQVEA